MSGIAIRCDRLGKRYTHSLRARSTSFREAISAAPGALLRSLARNGPDSHISSNPRELWALRDVDLTIEAGQAIGVIGRNGAGKSTLLKILARVTKPTEGAVEIAGRVGSLLEVGTGFHSELTGRENIRLYGAILGMKKSEIDRKFDQIVEFAEIEEFLDTPVKRYSSGMYMRLGFAVAAHLEPEILLVDEVLAVGDVGFQRKCIGRVGDVAQEGRTVLFVSHNLQGVQRLCTHSLILHRGRLEAFGRTEEMILRYLSEFSTDSAAGTWIQLDVVARTGQDVARFRSVRYGSAAEGDSQPSSRRSFFVEAEILCSADIEAGSYAVIVYDRFGTKLINADTALYGQRLSLRRGVNRVRTDIPRLGLAPGTYSLGLWVARGSRDVLGFDFVEQATWFDVTDPDSTFIAGATNEGSLSTDFVVTQVAAQLPLERQDEE